MTIKNVENKGREPKSKLGTMTQSWDKSVQILVKIHPVEDSGPALSWKIVYLPIVNSDSFKIFFVVE